MLLNNFIFVSNGISLFIGLQNLHIFCIKFLKYLHIAKLENKYLLFFTFIIINPIRSGEKLAFSEEVREKHIGFREIVQGKFVLLKQKSEEFFSESPYKPCVLLVSKFPLSIMVALYSSLES